MSDLRDARFRKALEHAPDADLRPGDAARRQILSSARDAVREAPSTGWWRAIWAPRAERMPWNAALATVAVASLITVLWHDKEVPDARPEATAAGEPTRAPVPATSAPSASAVGSASSAPAKTARPPASVRAARKEERRADTPAASGVLRDSAPAELAKVAPGQSADAAAQAPTAGTAVPPMATAPAPRAPVARIEARFAPSPVDAATQLHVRVAGRTIDAALQKPSRLADLLQRIAREPRNAEALETGVDTLIELRQGGELIAMLELAGEQARWTVLRPQDGAGGAVRPQGDLVRQLREELVKVTR